MHQRLLPLRTYLMPYVQGRISKAVLCALDGFGRLGRGSLHPRHKPAVVAVLDVADELADQEPYEPGCHAVSESLQGRQHTDVFQQE